MASDPNKKQHTIPACYLRAWSDPANQPLVWVFDRETLVGGLRSPKKAEEFWEEDFYTRFQPDGSRDVAMEQRLGRVEDTFVKVRDKLLASSDFPTKLERSFLCLFTAIMWARTRVRKSFEQEMWGELLDFAERHSKGAQSVEFRMPSRNYTVPFDELRAHIRQPMPSTLAASVSATTPILAAMDFLVLETDDPIGFVTSDNPCVLSSNEKYPGGGTRPPGLIHPSIGVVLPISPRQAILLNRRGRNGRMKVPGRFLTMINHNTLVAAERFFVVNQNSTKDDWFVDPAD